MGRFLRPTSTVLPDSALVPDENILSPPTHFTHVVKAAQPYHYALNSQSSAPDGILQPRERVLLFEHDGGEHCRVVTSNGVCVTTDFGGLRKVRR